MGKTWFDKHLNWVLFLGVCALQIVGYPILMVLAGGASSWDFWLGFSMGIILYYGLYDGVLTQKGWKKSNSIMSFVWLLLWLTGWIGVVVLLLVKNKIAMSDEALGGKR